MGLSSLEEQSRCNGYMRSVEIHIITFHGEVISGFNFYTRLWHLVAEDELLCVKRISRLKFLLLIRFNCSLLSFPTLKASDSHFPVVKLKFGKSRKILWNQKIFKSGRRSM